MDEGQIQPVIHLPTGLMIQLPSPYRSSALADQGNWYLNESAGVVALYDPHTQTGMFWSAGASAWSLICPCLQEHWFGVTVPLLEENALSMSSAGASPGPA